MCIVLMCASVHNKSVACRVCARACPCMDGVCAVSCLCHGTCVISFWVLVFFPRIPGVKGACRTLRRETGKSPAEIGARREMSG
jgi:hypothetical protein